MQLGMLRFRTNGATRRFGYSGPASTWPTTFIPMRSSNSTNSATGAASLADMVKKLAKPRQSADGAGGRRRSDARASHRQAGDVVIDGGNSDYVDDLRLRCGVAAQGDRTRRCRHQRRRVGVSGSGVTAK